MDEVKAMTHAGETVGRAVGTGLRKARQGARKVRRQARKGVRQARRGARKTRVTAGFAHSP